MHNKFWMLKGSAGAPTQPYPSREAAERRAEQIAVESGKPCYVLEAVAVYLPEVVPTTVTRKDIP